MAGPAQQIGQTITRAGVYAVRRKLGVRVLARLMAMVLVVWWWWWGRVVLV